MSALLDLVLCDLDVPSGPALPAREVRARDATGSFSIRPGHADFVACLVPSILEWTLANGRKSFAGVPGGILRVADGRRVDILGRRIYRGSSIADVATELQSAMRRDSASAAQARQILDRLEAELVGNLVGRKSPASRARAVT